MFFSGFCDEAGPDIQAQIKAQKAIGGFDYVEMRMVDGKQFTDLDDDEFERVWAALQEAGLGISSYGSAIANWSRDIDGDFEKDLGDLKRAAPRMRKTGTKFIRVMSWVNRNNVPADEWHKEAVRRMKELAKIAEDHGIILGHENCNGWAGESIEKAVEFIDEVDSPAFQWIFDTGNPPHHDQDSIEFFHAVKHRVVYCHVKDYKKTEDGKLSACFPGEGIGKVREVVSELLKDGYDGGFSIEPHIAGAIHEGDAAGEKTDAFSVYVEYGKRFKKLVEECRAAL